MSTNVQTSSCDSPVRRDHVSALPATPLPEPLLAVFVVFVVFPVFPVFGAGPTSVNTRSL
jgi:hypothetical protein